MIKYLILSFAFLFHISAAREDFPTDEPVGDTESED